MANTPNLDLENLEILSDSDTAYDQIVTEIVAKINNNNNKLDNLPVLSEHLVDEMPHTIVDTTNNIKYRYGLRISNGVTQFIYEKIV